MFCGNFLKKLLRRSSQEQDARTRVDIRTETEDAPLPFIGENGEIASESLEIEMFSYAGSFLALKEEIKRQNRSREKTNERLLRVLDETEQLKQDYKQRLESFESEKEKTLKAAELSLLKSVLPALDGLDFAVKSAEKTRESLKNGPLSFFDKTNFTRRKKIAQGNLSGLIAIRERFHNWLAEFGASPIRAEKTIFDSRLMIAVDSKIVPGEPHNTVIEEARRGYQKDGLIIRPAEVIISINPDDAPT